MYKVKPYLRITQRWWILCCELGTADSPSGFVPCLPGKEHGLTLLASLSSRARWDSTSGRRSRETWKVDQAYRCLDAPANRPVRFMPTGATENHPVQHLLSFPDPRVPRPPRFGQASQSLDWKYILLLMHRLASVFLTNTLYKWREMKCFWKQSKQKTKLERAGPVILEHSVWEADRNIVQVLPSPGFCAKYLLKFSSDRFKRFKKTSATALIFLPWLNISS